MSTFKSRFILVAYVCFALLFTQTLASDYPKSQLEQEMDEIGSLIEGEGGVFRPVKEKSDSTKVKHGSVNQYLYRSSLDILKKIPLLSADAVGGVIITDWHYIQDQQEQKNIQSKVTVYISGDVISPEVLEVVVLQRGKDGYQLQNNTELQSIAFDLENKIIRKARDMYLHSKRGD